MNTYIAILGVLLKKVACKNISFVCRINGFYYKINAKSGSNYIKR